jgi:hypothetical protein
MVLGTRRRGDHRDAISRALVTAPRPASQLITGSDSKEAGGGGCSAAGGHARIPLDGPASETPIHVNHKETTTRVIITRVVSLMPCWIEDGIG